MRILAVAAFLAAAPLSLYAQSAYGRIVGRVTDAAGAVVPGVPVRAVHLDTNVATQTSSNDEGNYDLQNLTPGEYRLAVEMRGFKRHERGPIQVVRPLFQRTKDQAVAVEFVVGHR